MKAGRQRKRKKEEDVRRADRARALPPGLDPEITNEDSLGHVK